MGYNSFNHYAKGVVMQRVKTFFLNTYRKIASTITPYSNFTLYAVLVLIIMYVAYNIMVPNLGFYYDDWEGVLIQKQHYTFQQIWNYFLIDRPFSAIVHFVLNPIVGTKPANWHIVGMLVNWAAVLFFVKTLLRIWPKRILEIGWIGLLLAVYPGITREFVIRTSMVHYISMMLFGLSLLLMIKAVQEQKHRGILFGISLVLSLVQMLIIEYFAGLELIRVLLLFYLFKQENISIGKAIKKAVMIWLPYVFVLLVFFIFRFSILPGIQQDGMVTKNSPWVVTQLLQDPIHNLIHELEIILQDSVYAVLYVWSQTIVPEQLDLEAMATLASWAAGAIAALLAGIFMYIWYQKSGEEKEKEPLPLFLLLLCVFTMLFGGLPIWAVGRQAIKGLWASRYLFGLVLGAVPLLVIILSWAFGKQRRVIFNLTLSLLLMSSIALQFRTAKTYALTWHYTKDYFWQLKWRAPALKPGTFILSPYTPYDFSSDYEIAFATNVLYDTGNNNENATYWWFDGPDDIVDFTKKAYPEEMNIEHHFRNITFISSMEYALPVIYKPSRGCLQVVDTAYQNEPLLLSTEVQLFPTVKSGLILNQEQAVPEDIFGAEPDHTWCYYYQSADLARSEQQWTQVVNNWESATKQNLTPTYGPEYLPFIEAFARLNQWDESVSITKSAMELTEDMEPFLCKTWERILSDTNDTTEKNNASNEIMTYLQCANGTK